MHDLERAEQRLIDAWLTPVVGSDARIAIEGAALAIESGKPGDAPADVTLRLLDLAPSAPVRTRDGPALQLIARYAVTAVSRHVLADLAFAAMSLPPLELDRGPVAPGVWAPAPPAPSFVLRVPVPRTPPAKHVPRVRIPLEMSAALLRPFAGVVVAGADDTPVAGAVVELPSHGFLTHSDADGAFRFAALPPSPTALQVSAKGCSVSVRADPGAHADMPFVVRLPLPET